MENEQLNNTEMSDTEMDSLISGEESQETAAAAPQAPVDEFTLKVNGQEIKANREKVLQWAQMGYGYPQKAAELQKAQEEVNRKLQEKEKYWSELEQKWSPYKQVDEYATQNKDWWEHVQSQYQQKKSATQVNPEIESLKQELADIKKFKDEIVTEKTLEKNKKEDADLDMEVSETMKQYPNIDFKTIDETGKSLEAKIVKHAIDNNIASFRVAFRDFYHDHLLSKAEERGKEAVAKDLQKRTKLGVLSESPKSTKGFKVATDLRSKSYNDLLQEALDENTAG